MPLQFVLGPSGSGKSTYLYQQVIDESSRHPNRQFVVLVPEQFTMQTQKDLVSMHPHHGIMNIDVLSFGRLAHRVLDETGGGTLPVLDDEGKNLILRKIAGQYEDRLKVLSGNMKKLGYISEVKSVISEFTQYDIGEDEIDQVMELVGEHSRLYYKLQDMKILYRGFTEYLEQRYITKEELLDVLSDRVCQSSFLKDSTVVLDGFTGFTPVQNRLLLEMMRHCSQVIVTVTMDDREDPYVYQHPYQLFGMSKQMVTSLIELARGAGIELAEPVCMQGGPVRRFAGNEAMAFLERQIFRHGRAVFDREQEAVKIHAARNPREEARVAAGRIRNLIRTQNYRYRDVGVIVSDMEVYGDYLREAFDRYEIPVFMDQKRSILLNPFVEYIRSLLNLSAQQFSYESVFRFLRTGLAGFEEEELDELENYVLGLGIRGYKKWQEPWIRRLKGMQETKLERLNHHRRHFVEKVDGFVSVLRQRKKTVRDITLAVYEFMVREELQRKLKNQEEAFKEAGELALAKEYAQVYRIVVELFDKFVSLLGDETVGLDEYIKLLDAGLEEAKVGVIPPTTDQVVAGDMERTRLKDIKALFFLGANDAYLPGKLGKGGLLSEQDRDRFAQEKLTLSPGSKEKAYVQKFYLYMNLTKPSQRLEVYYSKTASDGKSSRPSYLIQELRRLYPALEVEEEEEKVLWQKELTEKTAVTALIQGLQDPKIQADTVWQELYSWYKKNPSWQAQIETLLDASFLRANVDGLTREIAAKLYGETFENSITRMERYASCAFAHFLTYGLSLRERQEYEFQAVDLGNVCHSALERYAKRVESAGQDWTEVQEKDRKAWMADSVSEAVTDYGNSVLYSSARNEYMTARIGKMLDRTVWALTEQLKAGDFKPAAYELRFANGKIDRVDICEEEDKVYVKVVDYKTGKKAFDIVALYHGLQLQLMVYMDAAAKREESRHPQKEIVPAGVFYYRIQDPLVEKGGDILKELKPDGLVNLKEEALTHLERNLSGESMAVPVRFNKNGSLAKGSKAVSEEEFHALMEYAVQKVGRIHEEIAEGTTRAQPYRRGQETGCDYCKYRHVCGFDTRIPGYEYRNLDQMSKEEAIAAMKGEVRA